jgi:hypothetical protein
MAVFFFLSFFGLDLDIRGVWATFVRFVCKEITR